MRIAIFTDYFYPELGGIQDSIVALTGYLASQGHSVLIYAPQATAKDYALARVPNEELRISENVEIRRLFSVPFPNSTQQTRLVVPTFLRWLDLKKFKPDILHTNSIVSVGLEALVAAKFLKIPLVGTQHLALSEFGHSVPISPELFKKVSLGYASWYYNHCTALTGPSHSIIDEMKSWGVRIPSHMISNPIDTETFRPFEGTEAERKELKQKFHLSEHTIVYAGRMAFEKNIDVVVRAVAIARQTIPDIVLALAGHGTDMAMLQAMCRELGIEKSVIFVGTLSKPELARLYQSSEVFVTASVMETQNLSLLQAMACGLPAVGVNARALPEYINSSSGVLVEPFKEEAFSSAVVAFLMDADRRQRIGRTAVSFANTFSVKNVGKQWEKFYDSMISKHEG